MNNDEVKLKFDLESNFVAANYRYINTVRQVSSSLGFWIFNRINQSYLMFIHDHHVISPFLNNFVQIVSQNPFGAFLSVVEYLW